MSFQLFAMTGLFRNQQVAGSIPAGGSIKNQLPPGPARCRLVSFIRQTFEIGERAEQASREIRDIPGVNSDQRRHSFNAGRRTARTWRYTDIHSQ
jgi:hypothetical protein